MLAEQILRKIENGEINPETELGIKKGRETPRPSDNPDKPSVSDMLNEMNQKESKKWCCKSN